MSPSNIATVGATQTGWILSASSADYAIDEVVPVTVTVTVEYSTVSEDFTF